MNCGSYDYCKDYPEEQQLDGGNCFEGPDTDDEWRVMDGGDGEVVYLTKADIAKLYEASREQP